MKEIFKNQETKAFYCILKAYFKGNIFFFLISM